MDNTTNFFAALEADLAIINAAQDSAVQRRQTAEKAKENEEALKQLENFPSQNPKANFWLLNKLVQSGHLNEVVGSENVRKNLGAVPTNLLYRVYQAIARETPDPATNEVLVSERVRLQTPVMDAVKSEAPKKSEQLEDSIIRLFILLWVVEAALIGDLQQAMKQYAFRLATMIDNIFGGLPDALEKKYGRLIELQSAPSSRDKGFQKEAPKSAPGRGPNQGNGKPGESQRYNSYGQQAAKQAQQFSQAARGTTPAPPRTINNSVSVRGVSLRAELEKLGYKETPTEVQKTEEMVNAVVVEEVVQAVAPETPATTTEGTPGTEPSPTTLTVEQPPMTRREIRRARGAAKAAAEAAAQAAANATGTPAPESAPTADAAAASTN